MLRSIRLRSVPAAQLHAIYEGLAESLSAEAAGVLLWMEPEQAHLSLGATQSLPHEINQSYCQQQAVPIVQRALGGGLVWVDAHQPCTFLILPKKLAPKSREGLFDVGLQIMQQVYRQFSLPVERIGQQDLWLHGQKILGSGAATAGQSHIFGCSFLLKFPAEAFAACVKTPSERFRAELIAGLQAGMTDWQSHQQLPNFDALHEAWLQACAHCLADADIQPCSLSNTEQASIAEVLAERAELDAGARRQVRYGLKINQRAYVLEMQTAFGQVNLRLEQGRIASLYCDNPAINPLCAAFVGLVPEEERLRLNLPTDAQTLALISVIQQLRADIQL